MVQTKHILYKYCILPSNAEPGYRGHHIMPHSAGIVHSKHLAPVPLIVQTAVLSISNRRDAAHIEGSSQAGQTRHAISEYYVQREVMST